MSVHVTFVSMHVFTLDIWNSRRFDSLIFTFVSMHVFTLDIWNSRHFDSLIFTWGTKSCGWKHNAGNQKLWEIPGIRGSSLEPSSSNSVRENLGHGNFCEAWAPRSVSSLWQVLASIEFFKFHSLNENDLDFGCLGRFIFLIYSL